MDSSLPSRASAARSLVELGQRFYARNWVLGTSGNFSIVTSRQPLLLAITASGLHKGTLKPSQILTIDDRARARRGGSRPSAETQLHLEVVRATNAGAVLHTHSVWATMLSSHHQAAGGLAIEGYEMLKGLEGVASHEHREWIPILANDQDISRLSASVRDTLADQPSAHAFLIAGHGLYTWGADADEAERHVEILEFLFEVEARRRQWHT